MLCLRAGSLIAHNMGILRKLAIALAVILLIVGIAFYFLTQGDTAGLSVEEVAGPDPPLEAPEAESFPTVQIAKPVGWGEGEAPTAADGLTVNRFAEGLEHPRVLYALPNGDGVVTLTRAPAKEEGTDEGGFMASVEAWVADYLFEEAGSAGASPNQIVLLRDADGDGVAEKQKTILTEGLDSPSGMGWLMLVSWQRLGSCFGEPH